MGKLFLHWINRLSDLPQIRVYIYVVSLVVGIHVFLILFFYYQSKGSSSDSPIGADERQEPPLGSSSESVESISETQIEWPASFDTTKLVTGNIPGIAECSHAQAAIVVDLDGQRLLWSKNPEKILPIDGLAKLMTAYTTLQETRKESSQFKMDTVITATAKADALEGKQNIPTKTGEQFTIESLLQAMIIPSADDAAYLLSEALGGGEPENFIAGMNLYASMLGMNNTKFVNAYGQAGSPQSTSCAEDLAKLATALLNDPAFMRWSSQKEVAIRPVNGKSGSMRLNYNNLVKNAVEGVDGMGTGYIPGIGFHAVVSSIRDNRRYLTVVLGIPRYQDRDALIRKVLDWSYDR